MSFNGSWSSAGKSNRFDESDSHFQELKQLKEQLLNHKNQLSSTQQEIDSCIKDIAAVKHRLDRFKSRKNEQQKTK